MTEKDIETVDVCSIPKQHSLFRLVRDQARIDEQVLSHRYAGAGTSEDPYIVTWIADDAGNPMNWSTGFKWTIAVVVSLECFVTAFSSSAFSGCLRELVDHFQASTTLLTAGISLFVLGFALGPLLWAPLSEIYGRQVIFFITYGAFTAFAGGATANSTLTTLMVMRFLAGAFSSSPFTNAGGVIADIFPIHERGAAMSIFALAPSAGPTFGPFVGGFLGVDAGWRWVMGTMTILAGLLWILGTLLVPETYAPVLLRKRAAELSRRTGKVYKTKIDVEQGDVSVGKSLQVALIRPWLLLFMEPIVLVLSVYVAIVYGTLYLLFGAYPVVFQLERGWSEGVGGLPFLGVAIGMVGAIAIGDLLNKLYMKAAAKNGGTAPPEARLVGCMIAAFAIPIGLFWFAWGSKTSVHWLVPTAAGIPFGFGFTLVFLGIANYLIDSYTIFAASTLAASTLLRCFFGAAFPLFTPIMYENLGTQWASSIPGFLALVMVPAPFILYKYGAVIRSKCVYAAEAERTMELLRMKAAQPTKDTLSRTASSTNTNDDTDVSLPLSEKEIHQARRSSRSKIQGATGNVSDQRDLGMTSRAESLGEPAAYEASPCDIDLVNTQASVAGVDLSHAHK